MIVGISPSLELMVTDGKNHTPIHVAAQLCTISTAVYFRSADVTTMESSVDIRWGLGISLRRERVSDQMPYLEKSTTAISISTGEARPQAANRVPPCPTA